MNLPFGQGLWKHGVKIVGLNVLPALIQFTLLKADVAAELEAAPEIPDTLLATN